MSFWMLLDMQRSFTMLELIKNKIYKAKKSNKLRKLLKIRRNIVEPRLKTKYFYVKQKLLNVICLVIWKWNDISCK